MALPLPNLDDRRWVDLVEESLASIPVYAPHWTDHNIHDPGRMLIELFAAMAEMDIFWLNQIPDEHRRKFLALAGIAPRPPVAARGIVNFVLTGEPSLQLPPYVQLNGTRSGLEQTPLFAQTVEAVTLVAGELAQIQHQSDQQFYDLTPEWLRDEPLAPLGLDPKIGDAFYLGFTQPLPVGLPATIHFSIAGAQATDQERGRIHAELHRQSREREIENLAETEIEGPQPIPLPALEHHAVQLVWEVWTEEQRWHRLESARDEIVDNTRSLTLSGSVVVTMPFALAERTIGLNNQPLFFLRCRLLDGAYEAAPLVEQILLNGVVAEQAADLNQTTWTVASDAEIIGPPPQPNDRIGLSWRLNDVGEIIHLQFGIENAPRFPLLSYRPPIGATPGRLSIGAEILGESNGLPHQQYMLTSPTVQQGTFRLFTLETQHEMADDEPTTVWHQWHARSDFDTSGPADTHFVLDAMMGRVHLGDGHRGRVIPDDAYVLATYQATEAAAGNLRSGQITQIADTAQNQIVLADVGLTQVLEQINHVTNPSAFYGGAEAESIDEAVGRARAMLDRQMRTVTLEDYETLAREVPGIQLARVTARANFHPMFPGFDAPGVVTVIILPHLPAARPAPSQELRRWVTAYLHQRRVIGTRVEVVGPTYTEVTVRAQVGACVGVDRTVLEATISQAIVAFFHPLSGGPDGTGWPFGRDIYLSEVLQVIDEVPGVDHVLKLELLADGGEPQCANLCIGPLGLVASGIHEISVI